MRLLRVSREGDREDLPAVARRFSPDPAAEQLHQVLGNCKPQPETTRLARARAVHLVKALEHPAPVLRRDAGTTVTNADPDLVPGDLGMDVDGGARRGELGGIVEQVVERLDQLWPIGRDAQ